MKQIVGVINFNEQEISLELAGFEDDAIILIQPESPGKLAFQLSSDLKEPDNLGFFEVNFKAQLIHYPNVQLE